MRWASLVEDYGKELREGSPDSPATDVFCSLEEGEKRWKDLKNRVVEHVSSCNLLQGHRFTLVAI
jgi:26S proteasome regulatory subunit N5